MAETIEIGCDGTAKWHWYNIRSDLAKHLDGKLLTVDPLSVRAHSFGGYYDQSRFYVTWMHDTYMLLSIARDEPDLVSAFSAVLEYKPIASYIDDNMITYEWDKKDPAGRLEAIQAFDFASDIKVLQSQED